MQCISGQTSKYLINIKPAAPKLNIYIKSQKYSKPIRPVINNTQAPSYKTAKYLSKKLHNKMRLPYTHIMQKIHRKSQKN